MKVVEESAEPGGTVLRYAFEERRRTELWERLAYAILTAAALVGVGLALF